jgi:hypothetical protein
VKQLGGVEYRLIIGVVHFALHSAGGGQAAFQSSAWLSRQPVGRFRITTRD